MWTTRFAVVCPAAKVSVFVVSGSLPNSDCPCRERGPLGRSREKWMCRCTRGTSNRAGRDCISDVGEIGDEFSVVIGQVSARIDGLGG